MRVLLVGRRRDRDRLRSQLATAGVTIAGEAATPPPVPPGDVDAIVIAPPEEREPFTTHTDEASAGTEPLTAREREVLALLAEGLSNKGIATTLGISDQTVKFHVAAIIGKLGARNRTDAVRRAVRRGLVVI
jgi:DNA-binding NarL/FixJ family response regulator